MRRRRLLVPILLVLLPVFLVAGVWLGGHPDKLPGFARDAFVDDQQAQVYQQAIDLINHDYYRPVDRKQLLDKSIGAAVKSLDDQFSNYFSPKDYASFQQATEGQFEGVGMTVEQAKRGLRIMTVYAGSPASRGGLKSGDLITKVNGRSIAGASSEASTAKIKGPAGTQVTLTVDGGNRERAVTLKRAQVEIPVVQSSMVRVDGKKIGHVRLAGFTSGAHGEVKQAVDKLLHQGADGIVLDLRDNGGGLLNEAVLTASIFIPNGRIVSTKGRARPEQIYNAVGGAIPASVPVTVLVNRQSASASEIVTGALQDRHRAEVVGTRTFGKGVFQEIEQLSNGGALDITVGEYFLPSGRNIGGGGVKQGAGITPDVKAQDNPKTKPDEGLDAAAKVVANEVK
jgi:carboxyl-terminal processing protease